MKKTISIKYVLGLNPCDKYTPEYIKELFASVGCKKTMPVKKVFDVDIPVDDLLWLILREDFIQEKELHYFSIWCFENIAQKIWEKYYPDDTRPQEAIMIKKLWLEGKATDDELAAAWDAAWDAACASDWAAARDAAWDAAWDAASAAAMKKIKEHLKEMILKQNKG